MIKKILFGAGAVIAVMGLTVGVLYFIQQGRSTSETSSEPTVTVFIPDLSKDYKACSTLDRASIQSTLGVAASNLQTGENIGIVGEKQIGDTAKDVVADSQTCIYAFVTGGTIENAYNSSNAFVIQKTLYTNQSGPVAVIQQIKADPSTEQIETASDQTFYTANTFSQGPNAINTFELRVFKANEQTSYSIRQPAETATFTAVSARTALLKLVESAQN